MKKLITCSLSLFTCFSLAETRIQTIQTVAPKKGLTRILIDPGHGGHEWGAGGFNALQEKELSLKVAFMLKRQLERTAKIRDLPIEARLTRTDDVYLSLKDRVQQAAQWKADVFLSLHANAAPSQKLSGFEVYFQSPEATDDHSTRVANVENQRIGNKKNEAQVLSILKEAQASWQIEKSSEFATAVYSSMSKQLRPNVRGVRQAPFTVLSGVEMPALLIEMGYVTSPSEATLLSKSAYLKRVASAISSGVFDFLSVYKQRGFSDLANRELKPGTPANVLRSVRNEGYRR